MVEPGALQDIQQTNTLVEIITQTVNPEQVILFGSRATENPTPESDYDFMVIMHDVKNERQISRRIYHALLERRVDVAVDIVVVDADKLAEHRDTLGFIYRRALQDGEVCYDRSRV